MTSTELLNLFRNFISSGYYNISISSREVRSEFWFARGTICRKDSGEEVGGTQVSGENEEQALTALVEPLRKLASELSPAPHEWGRTELRKILGDYRTFNDGLTSILAKLQKSLSSETLTETELHDAYRDVLDRAIKGSVVFAMRLAQLPEQDRVDLMTSSDETYRSLDKPRNLDDIEARDALFGFMIAPSESVLKAHNEHQRRMRESKS